MENLLDSFTLEKTFSKSALMLGDHYLELESDVIGMESVDLNMSTDQANEIFKDIIKCGFSNFLRDRQVSYILNEYVYDKKSNALLSKDHFQVENGKVNVSPFIIQTLKNDCLNVYRKRHAAYTFFKNEDLRVFDQDENCSPDLAYLESCQGTLFDKDFKDALIKVLLDNKTLSAIGFDYNSFFKELKDDLDGFIRLIERASLELVFLFAKLDLADNRVNNRQFIEIIGLNDDSEAYRNILLTLDYILLDLRELELLMVEKIDKTNIVNFINKVTSVCNSLHRLAYAQYIAEYITLGTFESPTALTTKNQFKINNHIIYNFHKCEEYGFSYDYSSENNRIVFKKQLEYFKQNFASDKIDFSLINSEIKRGFHDENNHYKVETNYFKCCPELTRYIDSTHTRQNSFYEIFSFVGISSGFIKNVSNCSFVDTFTFKMYDLRSLEHMISNHFDFLKKCDNTYFTKSSPAFQKNMEILFNKNLHLLEELILQNLDKIPV